MSKLDKLKEQHKKMGDEIERLERGADLRYPYRPEVRSKYWYITAFGIVRSTWNDDFEEDRYCIATGNCYRSEDDAVKFVSFANFVEKFLKCKEEISSENTLKKRRKEIKEQTDEH